MRRVSLYALAAALGAALTAMAAGPYSCGLYHCYGVAAPSLHALSVWAALGAVAGVVLAAVVDGIFHGRYVLANRAEARARRRREAVRNPPPDRGHQS